MLWQFFSSKLDWRSQIISIAKSVSKKIGALIRSMKFLSPEVLLYLCESSYGLAWNNVIMSRLVRLAATWNCQINHKNEYIGLCRTTFLETLACRRNVASLRLFCRHYFGRFSSELAQMVPLHHFRGSSIRHSDRLYDFSVTIPRCFKVDFLLAQVDSLGILCLYTECFPLHYDRSLELTEIV